MESRDLKRKAILRRRIKQWSVEIVIACLLTAAALAYLGVTLVRTSDIAGEDGPGRQQNLTAKK